MVYRMKCKLEENSHFEFDVARSFEVEGHDIPNGMQAVRKQ